MSSGKDNDAGQNETTPIFQYVVLKAHSKRMYSNINYIYCFFDMIHGGEYAFLVTQLQSAITFIENLNSEQIRMSNEEFNKNIKAAEKRFELNEKNKKNNYYI